MQRGFVRAEIGPRMMAELVPPNLRILINPSWDDLQSGLADLQRQCRKHRMSEAALRALFERSQQPGFFSAVAMTEREAPQGFKYDVLNSQAAACWLGEGLTGFVLRRVATPPGEAATPPIYPLTPADRDDFEPAEWFESVCVAFWTRLTDEEITRVERWMLTEAMVKAAREDEIRRARDRELAERRKEREEEREEREREREGTRRRAMLALFKGVEPTFATHLSDACMEIADAAAREGQETVRWADVKKRWQATVDRYSNDLLPLLVDGKISVRALREIRGPMDFTLGFSLWDGAQRLFSAAQIVFRIECRHLLTRLAKQDPAIERVEKAVSEFNERAKRTHPTETWGVGWLRVHVDDGNRIVFVDEVQSDVMEMLGKSEHQVPTRKEAIERVTRMLKPWHLHGFASVRRWAMSIGYRAAIHSKQSSVAKPGMTRSERKWNLYYQPIIKLFGLREEAVAGYPARIMVEPRSLLSERRCEESRECT